MNTKNATPLTRQQYRKIRNASILEARRVVAANAANKANVAEMTCGALVVEYGYPTGFGCHLNSGHSGSHER